MKRKTSQRAAIEQVFCQLDRPLGFEEILETGRMAVESLNQAAVIATSPRGLPLLLEAGTALALRGAGYENEAAADMVFKPRSSGGLAAAIE